MTAPNLTLANVSPEWAVDIPVPDEIIAEIRSEHDAAQESQRNAVLHGIRVGELLRLARDDIKHGQWELWLTAKCKFSVRTARGYLRLAGLDAANRQRVAEMSLRRALEDIASESTKQLRRERELARSNREQAAPAQQPKPVPRGLSVIDAEIVSESRAQPPTKPTTEPSKRSESESATSPEARVITPSAPAPGVHIADTDEVQAIVDQIKTNLSDADLLLVAAVAVGQIHARNIRTRSVRNAGVEYQSLLACERILRRWAQKAKATS